MEFPELVHACSYRGCMEKNDFLPFTCDGCQKKFCLEHHRHENHGCHAKPRDDKYVPVCPLCMQAISVKPNDDVNAVIDQHIRAGCPTATVKSKKNACTFKGCREKEFVPISCKLCKQPFCLKHRFETDHDCPAKKSGASNATANATAAAAAAARQRQEQQKRVQQQAQLQKQQQQQQRPGSAARGASAAGTASRGASDWLSQAAAGAASAATTSPFSPFQGLSQPQRPSTGGGGGGAAAGGSAGAAGGQRKKTKHKNKPQDAYGAQGIPESERMLLSVYFPVSSNRPPEFHFLSVRWSVGKVIDTLASRGNIRNNNNQPGALRLNLFSRSAARLDTSSSLEAMVLQDKLGGGDAVILEYGDALVTHRPQMFLSAKDVNNGKDCIVM